MRKLRINDRIAQRISAFDFGSKGRGFDSHCGRMKLHFVFIHTLFIFLQQFKQNMKPSANQPYTTTKYMVLTKLISFIRTISTQFIQYNEMVKHLHYIKSEDGRPLKQPNWGKVFKTKPFS